MSDKHLNINLITAVLIISPLLLLLSDGQAETANDDISLVEISESMADLSEVVSKATVSIEGLHNTGDGRGNGSGFIVDAMNGTVVTNSHVVGDHKGFTIRFSDGREADGILRGRDPQTDLAVIKILGATAKHQMPWGDSDELRPGNLVMAIGSPLGLRGTTSLGVVGALHRQLDLVDDSYQDFIQHDAFIDHGSSGGPLLNMRGEVIGINTAIGGSALSDSWSGISYAIPSRIAQRYVAELASNKSFKRGYLGLRASALKANQAVMRGLTHTYGVLIESVDDDSPASRGGLKVNDVILKVDGLEIVSAAQLKSRIAAIEPGSELKFEVWSRRNISEKTVKIGVKQ
ncbi:MAG: trypsin-like peptidase domain-containing protein [Planctomycetes bacterium]|nr:trypsin-like peptidase domain-containing protein [Planctomycetota bacterium]